MVGTYKLTLNCRIRQEILQLERQLSSLLPILKNIGYYIPPNIPPVLKIEKVTAPTPSPKFLKVTHLNAMSVTMVRRRPRTDTATPMMEITLRLNGVMTVTGPGSVGLGRTSCMLKKYIRSTMLSKLVRMCSSLLSIQIAPLTTRMAKLVRWLQEQVTLPCVPLVRLVQPLSVQFPSPPRRDETR